MSDFMAKMQKNSISAGARPQTPLGELTALGELSRSPDPLAGLRGSTSKEKEGKERKGEEIGERESRKGQGVERRGEEGKRGKRRGMKGRGHILVGVAL